jgi:fumarate reductase subunit D
MASAREHDEAAGAGHQLGDVLEDSERWEVRAPHRGRRVFVVYLPGLEPIFWALFSAGGFVAAILIPAHVAILGIAWAAGWLPNGALSYGRVHHLVHNPLIKLYLWALISLPLYHWAHRFRFAIHHQFGIHGWKRLVSVATYGTAVAGTVLAAWVLLRI